MAFVISGIVWAVRGLLRVAFELVALGHRALGREMEFAADRMAVAVAGGDAIARGLAKAELADACFGAAVQRLIHAADQGLVTDDFFYHQARAIDEVRARAKRPAWGDPSERTADGFLFAPDATSKPSMWATHPPSAERERAARAFGCEADHDERPAWLLFRDPDGLRAEITTTLMKRNVPHAKALPRPAAEVEAVLDRERRETQIVERGGEMYKGRRLAKLDLDALFSRRPRPRAELEEAHLALYGARVEDLNRRFRDAEQALQLIMRARAGQLRASALVVDGEQRALADAPSLFEDKVAEMREIDAAFEDADREVAEVHAEMAIELGERAIQRLRAAYGDEQRYGRWSRMLRGAHHQAGPMLGHLQRGGELSPHEAQALLAAIEGVRQTALSVLEKSKERKAPKFLGLGPGAKLGSFLLPRMPSPALHDAADAGSWIGRVLADAAEIIDKLDRLHLRAIAALLHRHDEIHALWSGAAPSSVENDTETGAEAENDTETGAEAENDTETVAEDEVEAHKDSRAER